MDIEADLKKIAAQEERLGFPAFSPETAFELGLALRTLALKARAPVVIDVRFSDFPLFALALPGATPDNWNWVRRKQNVVFRYRRSSYAVGLKLARDGRTLADSNVDERDFAAHGGSVPIVVEGTGCVGAATVSGLPQRDDHRMVVEAMAALLGRDLTDCALP